jgi:Holliday junction DNA helicase RuvA
MIANLDGTLTFIDNQSAVVQTGGVGFLINSSKSTLDKLGTVGSRVSLYTHLHVREDNLALYGFASNEELMLFKELITVSGIGPKVALAFLSTFSTEQIIMAITSANVDIITQVPGIGKKAANRIVIELKGKLDKELSEVAVPLATENVDAVEALTNLGYSIKEANLAISSIKNRSSMELEEVIRLALQKLGK